MVVIDKKRIARTAAIARFARFIEKYAHDTDWTLLAQSCGIADLLDDPRHERVRRAQRFGDPDYPTAVSNFLQEIFDADEQIGLLVVHQVIAVQDELPDEAKSELNPILALFGGQDTDIKSLMQSIQPPSIKEFIQVTWLPDDFYKRLVEEINRVYSYGLPMSLSILVRKLFENLIIDILRRKYGTSELALYYDPSRGKFHDFSVLIRNLDLKIDLSG